jgi:hypothetical protein
MAEEIPPSIHKLERWNRKLPRHVQRYVGRLLVRARIVHENDRAYVLKVLEILIRNLLTLHRIGPNVRRVQTVLESVSVVVAETARHLIYVPQDDARCSPLAGTLIGLSAGIFIGIWMREALGL